MNKKIDITDVDRLMTAKYEEGVVDGKTNTLDMIRDHIAYLHNEAVANGSYFDVQTLLLTIASEYSILSENKALAAIHLRDVEQEVIFNKEEEK